MLSYRHAFHAGNHADVLKHLVLCEVLSYMTQKDKPFWYIDTHAGAGMYSLDSKYSTQNAEHSQGIQRLFQTEKRQEAISRYLEHVAAANRSETLERYPGSPWLAARLLRPQDRLRLFELHPTDAPLLGRALSHDPRVQIAREDGFFALKALLPPPPRRAVVLIDPSYEMKDDYKRVITSLKEALRRFATGTYLVWYPLLTRSDCAQLQEQLRKLPSDNWIDATLRVRRPSPDGFGMHGSGMFIINPPWTLKATLEEALPQLVALMRENESADFTLESSAP